MEHHGNPTRRTPASGTQCRASGSRPPSSLNNFTTSQHLPVGLAEAAAAAAPGALGSEAAVSAAATCGAAAARVPLGVPPGPGLERARTLHTAGPEPTSSLSAAHCQ
jgi:hypothetical protein